MAGRLTGAVVNCVAEDVEAELWVGTRYAGLACLRPSPLQVFTQSDGLPDNRVASISRRPQGGVYIVTQRGVSLADAGRLRVLPSPEWRRQTSLRSVFEDGGGRLWATTGADGLWALDAQPIGSTVEASQLLKGIDIRAVHQDRRGDIWLDCRGGLARWIPDAALRAGGAGIRGELWLLNENGIFRTVLGSDRYWTRAAGEGWQYTDVKAQSDFDPKTPTEGDRPGWTQEIPEGEFPEFDFTAIVEDAESALWFGTEQGGLVRLHDWKLSSFTAIDGLASERITALMVDSEGLLWVGGEAALSVLSEGRFLSLDRTRGFPADRSQQLLEDESGHLWVGGELGIYRLNRKELLARARGGSGELAVLAFNEADGLISTEVNGKVQPGACRTDDGLLWFPTAQGLVVIDPSQVRGAVRPPLLTVQRVRCAGNVVFDRDRYAAMPEESRVRQAPREGHEDSLGPGRSPLPGDLRLPPGSGRYLEIAYSALALTAPEKIRFKYRLEGHDQDWIEAGDRRTAYYTNLKPGAYLFRVTGGTDYGVWDDTGATLAFTLLPGFTETGWFYGLCVAAMAGMVVTAHRVRLNVVRRIQKLQHENAMTAEKTRIARDMHDDLGARLHEIILLSDTSRRREPPGSTGTSPVRAAARAAAQHLEEIVWAVQPGKDILRQVAAGKASKEIAADLDIALPTVHNHLRNVYEKLEVSSRVGAVVKYFGGIPGESSKG